MSGYKLTYLIRFKIHTHLLLNNLRFWCKEISKTNAYTIRYIRCTLQRTDNILGHYAMWLGEEVSPMVSSCNNSIVFGVTKEIKHTVRLNFFGVTNDGCSPTHANFTQRVNHHTPHHFAVLSIYSIENLDNIDDRTQWKEVLNIVKYGWMNFRLHV